MATSRSGAAQTLTIDGVAMHGLASGFTGMTLGAVSGAVSTSSGGLTVSNDSGYRVRTGSFTVNEDSVRSPALHGQNGQRKEVVYNDGSGAITFDAIITVSRSFNPRGARTFEVALAVDGGNK